MWTWPRSISTPTWTRKCSGSTSGTTTTVAGSPRYSARSLNDALPTGASPARSPRHRGQTMTKQPDPSPPPKKASGEERRFKNLLRKLLAVPKEEVDALEIARRKQREQRKHG